MSVRIVAMTLEQAAEIAVRSEARRRSWEERCEAARALRRLRKKLTPARRKAVFERDGHQCVGCSWMPDDPHPLRWDGTQYSGLRMCLEIDHIIPLVRGGTNAMSNLQTLCTVCNNEKGVSV